MTLQHTGRPVLVYCDMLHFAVLQQKTKKQDAHQLVGQAKCRAAKIKIKAVGRSFSNYSKCRSKVAGNVISSAGSSW